jgi:choice-of-anchor C domain-containing protein
MRRNFTFVFLFLTILIFSTSPVQANVIANPSFEIGTDPGSFTTVFAGNTNITNWTVNSGSVDYIGSYWQAADGNRSVDMDGNSAGVMSQVINGLSLSSSYYVIFSMAGNPDGGPTIKTLQVDIGPYSGQFTFDTTGYDKNNMGWVNKSFSFTPTASTQTLTFTSLDAGYYGAAIDNVRMVAPLPGTVMLLGTGLAGLVVHARRKRNG